MPPTRRRNSLSPLHRQAPLRHASAQPFNWSAGPSYLRWTTGQLSVCLFGLRGDSHSPTLGKLDSDQVDIREPIPAGHASQVQLKHQLEGSCFWEVWWARNCLNNGLTRSCSQKWRSEQSASEAIKKLDPKQLLGRDRRPSLAHIDLAEQGWHAPQGPVN